MLRTDNFRYIALADEIQDSIHKGSFHPGEKLPSLRQMHLQMGLSITTIHQAYIELEKRGKIEAREKSGFYVRGLAKNPLRSPAFQSMSSTPRKIRINEMARAVIQDLQSDNLLKLGAAVPSRDLMPLKPLARILKSIPAQTMHQFLGSYEPCEGHPSLREALARRMMEIGCSVAPENIITTHGCLDAVSLCLRATTRPGDTVLIESPAFHCFLQLLEDLNLYVVEIPGRADQGIDSELFEKTLSEHKIAACLLNSNFHNPLGSVVPRSRKLRILQAATRKQVPIIEDDIYGELFFEGPRPSTYKSMDTLGDVLYCSSFSKSLAPGLRLGWVIPGKFKDAVLRQKLNTSISSSTTHQALVAEFIDTGAYDRHLRQLRNRLKQQVSAMALAVSKYFPEKTRITFPKGGMCLWIELDTAADSLKIYHEALKENISILPGVICSSSDRYRNCLRLNCGILWDEKVEQGIIKLGRIITDIA